MKNETDFIKENSVLLKNFKTKNKVNIMEVCGTHTVAFFHTGVQDIFPENVNLVDGPGCPVCVTPNGYLDRAIEISNKYGVLLTTFGDMIKVPASYSSLKDEKAAGKKIEIVYSPMDALDIAENNPEEEVVFLSVGFETTTPGEAAVLRAAQKKNIKNFSMLVGNKLTPPAVDALLSSGEVKLDGFILPGHVSTITGADKWNFIAEKFSKPAVISGFNTKDLLMGTIMLLKLITSGTAIVRNNYKEVVSAEGNRVAANLIDEMFDIVDSNWRGIGIIPKSGIKLKEKYAEFDAEKKFPVTPPKEKENPGCRCGEVLKGLIKPFECPLFGKACIPSRPVGACMVSFEGACSAYYKYYRG